jgi:hypothetical protein
MERTKPLEGEVFFSPCMYMSQVFKIEPVYEFLNVILDKFCIKENNYYVIDYITFKKIVFHKYQEIWLKGLLDHYYKSKQFYITRKFTFQSFITIIRQLCKFFDIKYDYLYDKNQSYHHLKYRLYI